MSSLIVNITTSLTAAFHAQGDELVTTCWFNTSERENVTVGGFSFADEMCLNYVHYYPRTEALEICKSAVDEDDLISYFSDLKG